MKSTELLTYCLGCISRILEQIQEFCQYMTEQNIVNVRCVKVIDITGCVCTGDRAARVIGQ